MTDMVTVTMSKEQCDLWVAWCEDTSGYDVEDLTSLHNALRNAKPVADVWEPVDFGDITIDDGEEAALRYAEQEISEWVATYYIDGNPDNIRLCKKVEAQS